MICPDLDEIELFGNLDSPEAKIVQFEVIDCIDDCDGTGVDLSDFSAQFKVIENMVDYDKYQEKPISSQIRTLQLFQTSDIFT